MNFQDKKISARVDKIVFPKDESRLDGVPVFYIIKTDVGTVKGKMTHVPRVNEVLDLDGKWEVSKYSGSPEFVFFHSSVHIPRDERGILRYACEQTKGFGPHREELIWEKLGGEWRNLGMEHGIPGITENMLCELRSTIDFIITHEAEANTISWLRKIGLTQKMCNAAWEKWKNKCVETISSDIYSLTSLPGYGFKDVDEHIRPFFGIDRNDDRRIRACVKYYMSMKSESDTIVDWNDLYESVSKAIDSDPERIGHIVTEMMRSGDIVPFKDTMRMARRRDYECEVSIAEYVRNSVKIVGAPSAKQPPDREYDLDEAQMNAVAHSIENSCSVINGGAGCGKTTLIKAICHSIGDGMVELCAFAGKAAARLKEATSHDAGTIHRLLKYMGEGIGFALKSLEGKTVIVDEASMVSSDLMSEIVKRHPDRIILVGDEAQLPPVGSGQPFHDIIKMFPENVSTLSKCYRNKAAIFQCALMIRNGVTPTCRDFESDGERWVMESYVGSRDAHSRVLDLVKSGEIDFDKDIILCCRNGDGDGDSDCSVKSFNADIKNIVNPNDDGGVKIASGDRVINTKNCSDLDVWNGTTGRCREFDTAGAMWVDLDFPRSDETTEVLIPKKQVCEWSLAYALTVHKSQGSQYRKVIFVSTKRDSAMLLTRPMVYTAVTRARKECRIIGDLYSFSRAVGTVEHKKTVIQELYK